MYVQISDFFVVFSGLIPCNFSVSSEFLRKLGEGLKIGLSFIIGKLLGAGSKSALSNTNSGVVGQGLSTLKIRESGSIASLIIIIKKWSGGCELAALVALHNNTTT
jgi:hypothetical protein